MKAPADVTCIGEVIVDFVSATGGSLARTPTFLKRAGGASANVAVGLARLGVRSAFVGKVGNDSFGRFLAAELKKNGVDASALRVDRTHKTRLAFVALTSNGERDFEFWEASPADEQLRFRDINLDAVTASRIVHVSSFLLLKEPSRSAVLEVAAEARRRGVDVSFDPNIRLSLWRSARSARHWLLRMVRHSTVLRLNEGEARFLTGRRALDSAAAELRSRGPILIVITMGERGCYFQSHSSSGFVPGFRVRAVDTTGCGDGFLAGLLHGLVRQNGPVDKLSGDALTSICQGANGVGALAATRHGAMEALPSLARVGRFVRQRVG